MRETLHQALTGRRVGVVLSAGYFGFYAHAGFVGALRDAGIAVGAWAGTSAGGLVSAFCAAGVPTQTLHSLLLGLRRESFWDPDWWGLAVDALRGGARTTGLLRGGRFQRLLEAHLPERIEALPTPLVIVATNLSTQRPVVLTRGDLRAAVRATCAYPGMFQAVRHDDGLLWDGGLVDKAPALALHEAGVGQLDALLVHHLPSRDDGGEPRGPLAYLRGLNTAYAALRVEQLKLQLDVLAARGVPTYVVTTIAPALGPRLLHRGVEAIEAGRASLAAALRSAPVTEALGRGSTGSSA